MNHRQFQSIVMGTFATCMRTLQHKAAEYAREQDRLHNFKLAGAMQGITPEKALIGMWAKHVVSIVDMVDDIALGEVAPEEMWEEKMKDAINYVVLLKGLVTERLHLKETK